MRLPAISSVCRGAALALIVSTLCAQVSTTPRADGLYAEIKTSKGLIVARLEMDLTPMTTANFVGLAEGTIANAAFDPGRPFYDGTVYHRVVPGHVIQTGVPQSDRAKGPGYMFPNEIDARLSHNHAGALNMANSGPNTNAAQFCIMLGDRGYLDGSYPVFGEVMQGLDVVMRIAQGDVVESVRILRVGAKAKAFHPTTASFQAMLHAAEKRVAEHVEKKRTTEREWIARNYPKAAGPEGGVLTEQLARGEGTGQVTRLEYRGTEVRYVGDVTGREGPPIQPIAFASSETGVPEFANEPHVFAYEAGKTKVNAGFDSAVATMHPGEKRVIILPAAMAYGRAGSYPPEVAGKRRFAISSNAMLVYEIEALGNQ